MKRNTENYSGQLAEIICLKYLHAILFAWPATKMPLKKEFLVIYKKREIELKTRFIVTFSLSLRKSGKYLKHLQKTKYNRRCLSTL